MRETAYLLAVEGAAALCLGFAEAIALFSTLLLTLA